MKRISLRELTISRLSKSFKNRFFNILKYIYWCLKYKNNFISIKKNSDTAVLLANGPSLAKFNINSIGNDFDIYGMNRIYIDKKIYSRLRGVFLVNRLVAKQFIGDFKNLDLPLVVPSNLIDIFHDTKMIDILKFNPLKGGFAKSINDSFNPASTVTYFALQVLYVMGYNKVILIGLDHNFGNQESVNKTEKVISDTHHFNKDYFPKGIKWETPDLTGSNFWYDVANKQFSKAGRLIIDATENGKCMIFKKVSIKKLFKTKSDN